MKADLVQVYQTCMLVGASLTGMTAGWLQLLKSWQMVGRNCYRHALWLCTNVPYMVADKT